MGGDGRPYNSFHDLAELDLKDSYDGRSPSVCKWVWTAVARGAFCAVAMPYARIHFPSMCLVLRVDPACSGCSRSSLVLTLSRTMLISIEGMDDFHIEQLHPQGL